MRQTVLQQLPLVPSIDHTHSRDLAGMSRVLDQLPRAVLSAVQSDLRRGARSDRGRRGMAAEQVLRAMVLKQLTGMSYGRLSFAMDDSVTYRTFCRLGPGDKAPRKSTLQGNVKRLEPQTLEQVHCALVKLGLEFGVEDGQRVSVDSTAIEANIHHPTDSSLLLDCVEKLTSLLWSGTEIVGLHFSDHRKRAKRRALDIAMTKLMKKRVPLYKDLLLVVGFCLKYAADAVKALRRYRGSSSIRADRLADDLQHYIALAEKVSSQTVRRVVVGEKVPPSEKIVSIFEPHADIIIKDNRGTSYGHKAFLTIGISGLVLDFKLPRGNPADVTLTEPMIAALDDKHDLTPTEAAFDGGFCSHANLDLLKHRGVEAVAFTSPRGLTVEQMTGTKERFQSLRRFRACIEGTIGWLKNALGLRRCTWRGFASFQCYSWASVLSLNLLVIARRLSSR
jgi:IS5 family transposase